MTFFKDFVFLLSHLRHWVLSDPNLSSSLKILVVASTALQMTPSRISTCYVAFPFQFRGETLRLYWEQFRDFIVLFVVCLFFLFVPLCFFSFCVICYLTLFFPYTLVHLFSLYIIYHNNRYNYEKLIAGM